MSVLSKNSIGSEGIFYSPVKQQWCLALDTNGTVSGLIPRGWYSNKREALTALKASLEFRLGFTADCTRLYQRLDSIENELTKISRATRLKKIKN